MNLRRTEVRKDLHEELLACIATARLNPKKVKVQVLVGEPDAKRESLCFRITEDEVVLGTYPTTFETSAGTQRVLVGFIVPRDMLPTPRLNEAGQQAIAEALADAYFAELERTEGLAPGVDRGTGRGRQ